MSRHLTVTLDEMMTAPPRRGPSTTGGPAVAEAPRPAYAPGGLVSGPPLSSNDLSLDELRAAVEALRALVEGQRLFAVVNHRG